MLSRLTYRMPATTTYAAKLKKLELEEGLEARPNVGSGLRFGEWGPVVALCALVAIICSLDRTAMSVAILPMALKYNWSDSVKGAISSAFNLGHMITNLYGGYLAATMSPKLVLSAGVVVWSIFTILTPPAAATTWLPALLAVRAVMGLGEGVAFPTMQAIVKGWIPQDKVSRSLGLIYSGHQIGSILALLLSPFIIASTGVNTMFYVYGALGFVWLTVWDPAISHKAPLHNAAAHRVPLKLVELPWREFLANKAFWAILMGHMTFGICYNIGIAWLPSYYHDQHQLNVKNSALLSILPWAAMAIGTNASGWIADLLINKRLLSTTKTRKVLQSCGNAGPAVCLAYLAYAPQKGGLTEAVWLLTLTMGLLGVQAGGFASNHQDISSRYASMLFGVTNAACSLAGMFSVYAVGVALDVFQSWSLVFAGIAVLNFTCMGIYCMFATSEPQFD